MPDYTPFLITDLVGGQVSRRAPFLLNPDMFETLDNCNLKRGVLEKRRGTSLLGQILKISTSTLNPTLQENPVMGVHNHLSGDTQELIVFDKARMNTFVSSKWTSIVLVSVADLGGSPNKVRFTVASTGTMAADDIGTITNTTNYEGTYRIEAEATTTFDVESAYVAETFSASSQANQEQFTDNSKLQVRFDATAQAWEPAAGDTIEQVVTGTNPTAEVERVIVDYGTFGGTDAVGTIIFVKGTETDQFESAGQLFESGTPANIVGNTKALFDDGMWTGDNTNFVWIENWTIGGASKTYIANNNDPVMVYDGTDTTQLSIDIGTAAARDGSNNINSALLVFVIKERLVIFSTIESGTEYRQRARWSTIKDPTAWPTDNFVDAPTEDYIVTADFRGDDLYVWFENSVWRFAYTGDSTVPFVWERISAQDGAIAQMSITTVDNLQRAIGPTKIQSNDGNTIRPADDKVPDIVLDWNPDSAPYSVSDYIEEERQIFFTFARVETTANADGNKYSDRALTLNVEEDSWAVHRHEIHTMGNSALESDVDWDLDTAWEDIDFSWNASNTVSGFPFTLIGDHDGLVFQINVSGSDAGDDIPFNAKTARVNPYSKQGQEAQLLKVDFLCDVDADVSFDVEFFLNTDTTAYKTQEITTETVSGADGKAWYSAFADGATGFLHSLNIGNDASGNRPRIHAMRFWFKPGGVVQ